ncbi:MAG TPA: metallopeptidase TldD-related protein [Mycobacteriales bacterium]|nr:metallopeptidase TldD-related protein [Mycobacteriales bacterium]
MSSPQETVERALALSRADGAVVIATERSETNLRWANNTLTTNGAMRGRRLTVISVVDGAEGAASGVVERSAVRTDDLADLVAASERAARDAGPADDAAPLITPIPDHPGSTGWSDDPAETSVAVFTGFTAELGEALARCRAADRLLFGFAEHVMETTYLGSSTGLRLRHDQPTGTVELNAKSPDFASSAWVGAATRDFTDVDVAGMEESLTTRLGWADRRVDLPAGRYQTLLPPSAVGDLMTYLYWSSAARNADEGRTVFSKKGGGSRIGERLTEQPLSLRSDPAAPGLECAPFLITSWSVAQVSAFDNGMPTGPVRWIDSGELTSLLRPRAWANRAGGEPTGLVDNLILDSPEHAGSLEAMVASTDEGLLLTCLWYIREVDPQTLLLTGLTRDGVYLVRGGEVVGAVNNFRFNESPVDLLARTAEVGATERCLPREFGESLGRAAMPTLRIPDFNMSTVSQAS